MARYFSKAVSRKRVSRDRFPENDETSLPISKPYSLLSQVQDDHPSDYFIKQLDDDSAAASAGRLSRAESKFRIQEDSNKSEGYIRGSGKELALTLATLELVTNKNSIDLPDYIIILCCSVLSRVTANTLKDVKKARSIINIFLPQLIPRYPFSPKNLELYQHIGIFRFFTENNVEILKKIIKTSQNYRVLSEKQLNPFSSCLIAVKYRKILHGDKDWWHDNENDDEWITWHGWWQIMRPTYSTMINDKFQTRYEALNRNASNSLLDLCNRHNNKILIEALGSMLSTMHEGERSCFLLPKSNVDPNDPNDTSNEYLAVNIAVLAKKVVITNGNNLFTTNLSLDRFFGKERYSNFAQADGQFLIAEFDAQQVLVGASDRLSLDNQPSVFDQNSNLMITIRFKSADLGSVDHQSDAGGGRSESRIHEPIHGSFSELKSIWQWLVTVTPAEIEIKYTIINTSSKIEACHYLIWSANWKPEVAAGVDFEEISSAPPPPSATAMLNRSPPASNLLEPLNRADPLFKLRKLLKLALVDLKMEISLVAQAVIRGYDSRFTTPEASLCGAAIVRKGLPILEKANTINEEFGEAEENPEISSLGSIRAKSRYVCQPVRKDPVISKPTSPTEQGRDQNREQNQDRENLSNMIMDIFDTVQGGNYFFTKSLTTLRDGLSTRSPFVTRPLKLLNLSRLDPSDIATHYGECDGFYKRNVLEKGGIIYTVALVSGFSNWARGNAHKYFVDHYENVIIEMSSDHIFTGLSPFFICPKINRAISIDHIARISKNDIWSCYGRDIYFSPPCLYRMVELDINTSQNENTLFSSDFTMMWPSLSIHSRATQVYGNGMLQEHIQAMPTRKQQQSMHEWVKEYASYIIHGNMFLSRSSLICSSVFGRPLLLTPLRGELKDASAGQVLRGLGSTLSRDFDDKTRTATIASASIEQELSSIIAGKDLEPCGLVQDFLKTAIRDFKHTNLELPQTRSYLIVNADAQQRFSKTAQDIRQMLCLDHDFGRTGLWAMLYPTLFTEDVKNLRSGEINIDSLALCAWSYLILTAKFGRHKSISQKQGWTVGLIPANFDRQYMGSLEERAPVQPLTTSRTISEIMSTTQISDISDWDHLIIERNRHELFDVLLAAILIEAEKQSGDSTLAQFANVEGLNSDLQHIGSSELTEEQTLIQNHLARLLNLSFTTYMAPALSSLLKTFDIDPQYEKAVLDNCCQIVSGGSHLALNSSRKMKIIGWIGFIRGTSFEPIHKSWLDQGNSNRIDLRSSIPTCSEQLKVVSSITGQVSHTIFRAQMDIDRGAYGEVQIGDHFNNLEEAVSAIAQSFFETIIPANIQSLYIELLRRICKHRRTLLWPNTIYKGRSKEEAPAHAPTSAQRSYQTNQLLDGTSRFGKFARDSEYLENVNAQIPYGNTNPLSAIHLITSSVCRLLESGAFGASALWQSVKLICDLLLIVPRSSLNRSTVSRSHRATASVMTADSTSSISTCGSLGQLGQPEPISLRLIGLIVIPLRLLSAYHHLHSQPGPALAADNLGRFFRALLPAYLRCECLENLKIDSELMNLFILYKLPIGPASLKIVSDYHDDEKEEMIGGERTFKKWPGLELQAHQSLLAESGSLDKYYVASILETNYLTEKVLEAWVRCAIYLTQHQPPILNFDASFSNNTLPSPSTENLSSLIEYILSQTTIFSAGLNGVCGLLGLGGISRFLPYDPTMAYSEPKLKILNDQCRYNGNEIWLSMACQGIFDGGMNTSLGKILKIDCAEKHTICLTETGQLIVFGSCQSGQLGFTYNNNSSSSSGYQVLPSGLVRSSSEYYGIRRMIDQTKNLQKGDRLKGLRCILQSLVANPQSEYFRTKQAIHTPLLLTLSENGRPTQISNICCGAMFTVCVTQPPRTIVIFWSDDSVDFEDELIPDEHPPTAPQSSKLTSQCYSIRSSTAPPPQALHPIYTDSNVLSISAGVSHWVSVVEDGYMLVGGENSAHQLGPWRPLTPKTLDSMSSLLDIHRLDCYIANNDLVTPPTIADLINFASLSGSPALQTYPGGQACVFRANHESKRLIMIVGRPYKKSDSNKRIGCSATPSPRSPRQNINVGCLKDFHAAKFVAADCGETHTICLIDDTCTKERYALSWGSNDLSQQFPLAESVVCTTGSLATPGVIRVRKDFEYALAGAASSAVGNTDMGIWCGTELNGHLGLTDGEEDEKKLHLESASLSVCLSRFSLSSAREIEDGRYQLYGPKPLGNFLAPRFLEEGVIRAWRERETKMKRSSTDRIRIPWSCRGLSFGTDHIVCLVSPPGPAFRDSQCRRYFRELCFNITARVGRRYLNLEDAINNFEPAGGVVRALKGPPRMLTEPAEIGSMNGPTESLELPLNRRAPNSPQGREEGMNTKWLQKGIEGVSKFVDLFVTNILKEATTTTGPSGDEAAAAAAWPTNFDERRSTIATTNERAARQPALTRTPSSAGRLKYPADQPPPQRGPPPQPPVRQSPMRQSPMRQPPQSLRQSPVRGQPLLSQPARQLPPPPLVRQPPLTRPQQQARARPPAPPMMMYKQKAPIAQIVVDSQFQTPPQIRTPERHRLPAVRRQLPYAPQIEHQNYVQAHSRQSSRIVQEQHRRLFDQQRLLEQQQQQQRMLEQQQQQQQLQQQRLFDQQRMYMIHEHQASLAALPYQHHHATAAATYLPQGAAFTMMAAGHPGSGGGWSPGYATSEENYYYLPEPTSVEAAAAPSSSLGGGPPSLFNQHSATSYVRSPPKGAAGWQMNPELLARADLAARARLHQHQQF